MSKIEERLYLSLTRAELDQVSRALAVAAAADTGPELVALGMALAGRAVPASELVPVLKGAMHALRSYQYGNAAPDLAAGMAEACRSLLERLARGGDAQAREAAADPIAGGAPDPAASATTREDQEAEACWEWAQEAGHRAVVDGRDAVDGAALDAWQERARRASREVLVVDGGDNGLAAPAYSYLLTHGEKAEAARRIAALWSLAAAAGWSTADIERMAEEAGSK